MSFLRERLMAQFGNPTGLLGRVVGFIMRVRPSNRVRNLRTVELLDIQPNDLVLEIGFGPGLAIERAAALATDGMIVGVDRSALMLGQAARRNAAAIASGRVRLFLGTADGLPPDLEPIDKVLAVNVYMFWSDPAATLTSVRRGMRSGGTIAITLQPRQRGATRSDTGIAAERISSSLHAAGFVNIRTEILEMRSVPAACLLATA